MRYRVTAKQYKQPGHLLVRLEDGRVVRGEPGKMGLHLAVGDSGRIVNDGRRDRFKQDAIDLDFETV